MYGWCEREMSEGKGGAVVVHGARWAEGGSGCGVTAAGGGDAKDDNAGENKSEPAVEPDREMFG